MATRAALLAAHAYCQALEEGDPLTIQSFFRRDCLYRSPDGIVFRGPEIVNSYRTRTTWARNNLGELTFHSEVADCGAGVEVRFTDRIRFYGREHTYRLTQYLEIENGKIVRLEDRENSAEERALEKFFQPVEKPRDEPEIPATPIVEEPPPAPAKAAEAPKGSADYDDPESAEDDWDDAGAHQESDNN